MSEDDLIAALGRHGYEQIQADEYPMFDGIAGLDQATMPDGRIGIFRAGSWQPTGILTGAEAVRFGAELQRRGRQAVHEGPDPVTREERDKHLPLLSRSRPPARHRRWWWPW